jgi:hypothetical protein
MDPQSSLVSDHVAIKLTPVVFMRPWKLSWPFSWIEHIPFVFWLFEQHQSEVLVELGTYTGNSYLAFCQAVASLGFWTRCFAVDTWKGDEHAGFYDEDVFEVLSGYHDQNCGARSTFDEALRHFLTAA